MCAFGILFGKWRLMSKCVETKVDLIDHIVKCMRVLHNTIIDKEGVEHHLSDTAVSSLQQNDKYCWGKPSNEVVNVREIF